MSHLLRPAGPLPPGVYWVRRLLVVVALVFVGLIAWWLFFRPGDATPQSAPATSPSTSSPFTSDSPSQSPTETSSKSPSPTASNSPSGSAAYPLCASDAIQVSVTTDRQTYRTGQLPQFTLAVQNTSDITCRRDVGQRALELRVSSGGAAVWSSDDCNPGGSPAVRVFGPGDRYVQRVTWDRQQSAPGCPANEPTADPGTYQVVARNQGLLSQPATFVLQ